MANANVIAGYAMEGLGAAAGKRPRAVESHLKEEPRAPMPKRARKAAERLTKLHHPDRRYCIGTVPVLPVLS